MWSVACIDIRACKDSLVRFQRRVATRVIQTRPQFNITTLNSCTMSCLRNPYCYGFNWIRQEYLGSVKPACIQYHNRVGDTITDKHFDLYLPELCLPGMYRVQQT